MEFYLDIYVSVNRLHEWFSGPAHSTAMSMVARVFAIVGKQSATNVHAVTAGT